jgi:hypothetical protein
MAGDGGRTSTPRLPRQRLPRAGHGDVAQSAGGSVTRRCRNHESNGQAWNGQAPARQNRQTPAGSINTQRKYATSNTQHQHATSTRSINTQHQQANTGAHCNSAGRMALLLSIGHAQWRRVPAGAQRVVRDCCPWATMRCREAGGSRAIGFASHFLLTCSRCERLCFFVSPCRFVDRCVGKASAWRACRCCLHAGACEIYCPTTVCFSTPVRRGRACGESFGEPW